VKPQSAREPEATVRAIYRKLSRAWGRQHWWPAETPFEVIAGAILTQNTSWTNVERAMANLRSTGALNVESIRELALPKLEEMVRSSGYFRQKAQRLKNFVAFLDARYGGSLEQMFTSPTEQLRAELLSQNGIGPETADSILLYAGGHEIFDIDAYTRRILERHLAVAGGAKYDEIRNLIERALQREQPMESCPSSRQVRPQVHEASAMSTAQRSPLAQVYNEMHGLLVQVGKHYCLKQQPKCEVCPLGSVRPISIEQSVAGSGSRKTKAAGVQASG
jgi:endonuclease-3 related protein